MKMPCFIPQYTYHSKAISSFSFRYLLYLLLFFSLFTEFSFAQGNGYLLSSSWNVEGNGKALTGGVCDLNGDTFADVIVGNYFDTEAYFYNDSTLLPNTTYDLRYEGRILAVCDFNGDGNQDIITLHLTELDSLSGTAYYGELLYFLGSDTAVVPIDTIADFQTDLPVELPEIEAFGVGYFSQGVQTGDLNNDERDDIIINSYRFPSGNNNGRVDIIMGKDIPEDSSDYYVVGDNSLFGAYFDVADANGDGYDDLFISEKVSVISGNLPVDSLDILKIWYGKENFSFMENNYDYYFESRVNREGPDNERFSDWFRFNFSLADVNQDGYSDIVIGGLGRESDSTAIYFSYESGFDTIPAFHLTDLDPMNPNVFSGQILYEIGDFNNDGYDDLIMPGSKSFFLILGGPNCGNHNPFGIYSQFNAYPYFPNRVYNLGDYDNDGDEETLFLNRPSYFNVLGNAFIGKGDNAVTSLKNIRAADERLHFYLQNNYPNPFNPLTTISYTLWEGADVRLAVYNTLGEEVALIASAYQLPGSYRFGFDAANLPSGVYFYRLQAGEYAESKKMLLVK